ncbi:MAG: lactate utilization protein C [Eggerthellaceae bacterium]|nr:lactate utilization protein C [Eggerthellaceae bacterium]
MSTVSLEEFLKPISHALGRTEVPTSVTPCAATKAPLPHDYREYTTEELACWFIREAEKVGTIVKQATPAEVSACVVELVQQFGDGSHVVFADVPEIDKYQIPEALSEASLMGVRWDPTSREASVGRAENADVGITVASFGIAETATVIQKCTVQSGRSICLLPIGHIALLRKKDIFPYMTQLMESWEEAVASGESMPSNYTFISGPSNTADIELVRVVGVHGPVHTGVILIDD